MVNKDLTKTVMKPKATDEQKKKKAMFQGWWSTERWHR